MTSHIYTNVNDMNALPVADTESNVSLSSVRDYDNASGSNISSMEVPWQNANSVPNGQEETQRGPTMRRKRLLSLDGGGIRGISTLLILQNIMECIRDLCGLTDTPPPYKFFDLIAGTSTGGIIAIMLGPMRMTVAQCLKSYKTMAQRAFTPIDGWPYNLIPHLPGRPGGQFSGEALAEAVKDIVSDYKGDHEALFADTTCCKTLVLAVTKADVGAPVTKFKTYGIGDDFRNCKIWEIARATSAATTFFPSISCGDQEIEFIDAGFGHNNPTEVLLSEAANHFASKDIDCILSVGTGLDGVIPVQNSRKSIIAALSKMASNSQAVHRRLAELLPEKIYFRFNVIRGLDDVILSDWDKSSKISAHTRNYLHDPQVERNIKKCARILIQGHNLPKCRPNKPAAKNPNTLGTIARDNTRHGHYLAYALSLEQNLPPQVLLNPPVILYDALDGYFPFHVEWISDAIEFKTVMEWRTHKALEEKFKEKGSAKIRDGEFQLQDLELKRKFNIDQQPWSFIMRPGKKRHMSIVFKDIGTDHQSCPHCASENEVKDGEPTTCTQCGATYERLVELLEMDESPTLPTDSVSPKASDLVARESKIGKRKGAMTEPDLRLAFRRITLTSKVVIQRMKDLGIPIEDIRRELERLDNDSDRGMQDASVNSNPDRFINYSINEEQIGFQSLREHSYESLPSESRALNGGRASSATGFGATLQIQNLVSQPEEQHSKKRARLSGHNESTSSIRSRPSSNNEEYTIPLLTCEICGMMGHLKTDQKLCPYLNGTNRFPQEAMSLPPISSFLPRSSANLTGHQDDSGLNQHVHTEQLPFYTPPNSSNQPLSKARRRPQQIKTSNVMNLLNNMDNVPVTIDPTIKSTSLAAMEERGEAHISVLEQEHLNAPPSERLVDLWASLRGPPIPILSSISTEGNLEQDYNMYQQPTFSDEEGGSLPSGDIGVLSFSDFLRETGSHFAEINLDSPWILRQSFTDREDSHKEDGREEAAWLPSTTLQPRENFTPPWGRANAYSPILRAATRSSSDTEHISGGWRANVNINANENMVSEIQTAAKAMKMWNERADAYSSISGAATESKSYAGLFPIGSSEADKDAYANAPSAGILPIVADDEIPSLKDLARHEEDLATRSRVDEWLLRMGVEDST